MPKKENRKRVDSVLKKLYFDIDSPAAFSSPRTLYLIAREKNKQISQRDVHDWLLKQDIYTKFRRRVSRFPRRKVLVRGPNVQGQIDLLFFQSISKENKGFKYLLTYIDCFSRWAHVIPLKNKNGEHVADQFESKFIKKFPKRKPLKIQSDKGTEFISRAFQTVLRRHNISLFHTEQDVKASIVERFNRTLRELITKYIKHNQTLTYINALPKLIQVYNSRPHRTLKGHSPNDVNQKNSKFFYDLMYSKYLNKRKKKFKFKISDTVRISTYKKTFHKTRNENFTDTLYTVIDRKYTIPPTYLLAEKKTGEPVLGSFYAEELSLVREK